MKYIKRILFIFVLFTFNAISVNAGICDKENINYYKSYYDNLDITYEMDEDYGKGIYKININGLMKDTSVRIKDLDIKVSYNDENNGFVILKNIESGITNLSFYYDRCEKLITTRKIKIPIFNKYSLREECLGREEADVCKKDYEYPLNESTFLKKISDFDKSDKNIDNNIKKENNIFNNVIEFLKKYYLYIIGVIVIVSSVTVYLVVRKKKYTLE